MGTRHAACSCVSGQVPPCPLPRPLLPRKSGTHRGTQQQRTVLLPHLLGFEGPSRPPWFSSQPAKGQGDRGRREGSRRGVLSLPLQPSLSSPRRRSLPPGHPLPEDTLGPHSPQSRLRVSFSEVLLMALRFMMRAGVEQLPRKSAHYNPPGWRPRSAPSGRAAPAGLPAPRGAAPGTRGEGGSVPGLRSTLPWDSALSQPLLHLTVPNSAHFIGSSSIALLGLPLLRPVAASPEGPATTQRVVMKPGKGPREGSNQPPSCSSTLFLPLAPQRAPGELVKITARPGPTSTVSYGESRKTSISKQVPR